MSKEIKSPKVMDTNYIRLAQIYRVFKRDQPDKYLDLEKKIMYIDVITNHPDHFDASYKLPSDSFICRRYPPFSGNTISHLIFEVTPKASYYIEDYFEELIERGFGLAIQNDNGYTPLLLAFIEGMNIDKILDNYIKRKIVNNFYCKHGLSHLHVACTTIMTELVHYYLQNGVSVNERVNDDSPNFGGYTPLHFAMEYCQPLTIEFLLKNGASLNSKNADGLTPLHLLIKKLLLKKFSKDDKVQKFLQDVVSNNLFNLPDDVGFTLTHLRSITGRFENKKEITNIDAAINLDSAFFAGYTPLHFAAQSKFKTVTFLLKAGADILAKDMKGISPFDLCLERFNKDEIIECFSVEKRHQLSKLKFTNGVDLLEALKAMKAADEFEDYVKQKFVDINDVIPLDSPIWPGCSLLHLVVIFDGPVYKILACPNINHEIQDAKGMSPLHIAFRMKREGIVTALLNNLTSTSSLYPVDPDNLSYLHIACATKNIEAVKFLLNNGADPNLPTLCDFQWNFFIVNYKVIRAGSTPFHIAIHVDPMRNHDCFTYLLEYGAKPDIADADGETPYYIALWFQEETIFHQMLKYDKEFDSRKEYEKLGLTRLQLACFIQDLSMVKEELASGADVNKQISFDSKVWPGDTALHILFETSLESRNAFIQQLLAHGANPCLRNATTHLLGNNFYSENPVNDQGVSHFHMACSANNLVAVENYLKSGINVNKAIDYYAHYWPGFTPLHIAVSENSVKLIKLLFNYGADPNIKSSDGYTPLHLAVYERKYDSLLTLLRYPTLDIQAKNIFGDTAIEMDIRIDSFDHRSMEILLDKGACSQLSRLTDSTYGKRLIFQAVENIHVNEIFRKLISSIRPDFSISDDEGNNLIHHIASDNLFHDDDFWYVYKNIEILVDSGCEIDHKNNEGETPLHFAVSSENHILCEILLDLGADINIKDDNKKTPYFYSSDSYCKLIIINHILKLERVGFYIDKSNELDSDARDFYKEFKDDDDDDDFVNDDHYIRPFLKIDLSTIAKEKEELDSWLKKEINPTFSTAYIFSRQFLKDFKSIPESQRQKILDCCKSKDWQSRFPVLFSSVEVQFRRARMFNRLLVPAANSFQELTDLAIPEMCLEIVNYLDIDSLMNLVRAVNGKLEYIYPDV